MGAIVALATMMLNGAVDALEGDDSDEQSGASELLWRVLAASHPERSGRIYAAFVLSVAVDAVPLVVDGLADALSPPGAARRIPTQRQVCGYIEAIAEATVRVLPPKNASPPELEAARAALSRAALEVHSFIESGKGRGERGGDTRGFRARALVGLRPAYHAAGPAPLNAGASKQKQRDHDASVERDLSNAEKDVREAESSRYAIGRRIYVANVASLAAALISERPERWDPGPPDDGELDVTPAGQLNPGPLNDDGV